MASPRARRAVSRTYWYLHGGPGSSTSAIDYAFTRKWADVYTVVTWDQRNCGKSFHAEQNETVLTKELFMQDGKALTEFLLDYMGREKLTILGHSWGSCYGANLVLAYPEYYDCLSRDRHGDTAGQDSRYSHHIC